MAASFAYEAPTVKRAWDAFVAHLLTFASIWVSMLVVSLAGFLAYLLCFGVAAGVVGLSPSSEGPFAIAILLGQIGQLPFSILSSLIAVMLMAVPALYYANGEVISTEAAFNTLLTRPWRYLLAGLLFGAVCGLGLALCLLPGIAVALVAPIYVNRIFTSDLPVLEAFASSFQAVYRSEHGLAFVGIQLLAWLVVVVCVVATCGLASLVVVPMVSFYIQNAAYRLGVLS